MSHSKLGTVEAIMIIISVVVVHTILSLPKTLLDSTKSAVILNIIYVTIVVFSFVILICRLFKKFPGMDLIDISEFLGGKVFKRFLGFIFILYFVISSSILLRNFCECLQIINYNYTNISFIILFIIIAVTIVSNLEFNASFKTNLIIIPFVLFSIIFIFVANLKYFVPQRIFPILGEGFINTFITGLGNVSAFGGIIFLYFMPPLLKKPDKFKKIAITSVVLSSIYLILSVSIILFMFSFYQNIDEIMPLYSAVAYIEFGTFFQRLDSWFLFIWTLSFACYLSIVTNFSLYIIKRILGIKNVKSIIFPYSFIMFALALFPKNYSISKFFETEIYPYFEIALIFFISFFVLIFAYFKKKKVGVKNE